MSSPHTVQLYHVTLRKHVDDIKAHVRLDLAAERTDFRHERQAFYLTDNYNTAKTVMVEEVRGFSGQDAAIMTFSLRLQGLKIKTFSRELSGPALDEWRGVSMFRASAWTGLLMCLRQYVAYCREYRKKGQPPPPLHPIAKEGYDVIIGWMSTKKGRETRGIQSSDNALLTIHTEVVAMNLLTVTFGSMRFLLRRVSLH